MNADLRVVAVGEIRNLGIGDYFYQKHGQSEEALILAADTGDPDSNFLIELHELFECYLCKKNGVSEDAINRFDAAFDGPMKEPGDHPDCPYRREHKAAMMLEQLAATLLHVPWRKHEKRIDAALETD